LEDKTSEALKIKRFDPAGITCPEGMWVKEAAVRLVHKEHGEQWRQQPAEEAIQNLIQVLILTPELEVFSIDSHKGTKSPVNRDFLRSRSAVDYFKKGFKPFIDDFYVSDTDGYFFYLDRKQFENFLAGKPIVNPSEIQISDNVSPSYIPPYMQFMLEAVTALGLSQEKRTGKSVIVDWLRDNWPADLDGKSERMIESMATMLRSPEHKKGGNTSWKESLRR
tara:strand:- start:17231 stop:17896 length:666 start_codon:yes stop_codon:yes gene_type:complete